MGIHKAHSHIKGERSTVKKLVQFGLTLLFPGSLDTVLLRQDPQSVFRITGLAQPLNAQQNQNGVPDPPTINTAFFQWIIPNALNSAGKQHSINPNVGNVKHPRQLELETTLRSTHIWSVSEPPGAGYLMAPAPTLVLAGRRAKR